MREIKFRAWSEGKAIYPNLVGRYGNHFTVWCPDGSHADTHELEQFTGLYDKNGKEIYEGDICEIEYHDYEKEIMLVNWDEEKARFCFVDCAGDDWTITHTPIEVIDNIHENPELLQEAPE